MNLLVTNPTNIRYLTGFTGEGKLVISGTKKYLVPSPLYTDEANSLLGVEIIPSLNSFKTLAFEEKHLSVYEFNALKKKGIKLSPTLDSIEKMRMIKTDAELINIRRAASVTDQCYAFITRRIRPGITESRLAYDIEGFLRIHAGGIAFSPIVAFNEHASQPHYAGRGNSPLRRNSLILLDFGARVNGYCADMTRVIFFGVPKPEWVRAYESVSKAQKKAFTLLSSGERNGAALDREAKSVIRQSGFPVYNHSLGHNIGLDVHEGPRLTIKKNERLLPGMTFTIEPGIYIEGSFGVRIEDTLLLTKNGIEVLTKSPKL